MKILIRNTKFSDINQIDNLNRKCLPENYTKDFWIQKFNESKPHSFVAIFSGQIVGYIFTDNNFIISLAVDEKFRSKGIAKELTKHCLNTLKSIKLQVRISNASAINLYNFFGFTIKKTIKSYYISPDEDGYVMKWINKDSSIKFVLNHKINI